MTKCAPLWLPPAPDHMARITSSDSSNRATRSSRFTPNALNS